MERLRFKGLCFAETFSRRKCSYSYWFQSSTDGGERFLTDEDEQVFPIDFGYLRIVVGRNVCANRVRAGSGAERASAGFAACATHA